MALISFGNFTYISEQSAPTTPTSPSYLATPPHTNSTLPPSHTQQFDLKDRFEEWPFICPSCIIDVFKARIQQPRECSWEYITATSTFSLKYEVVCSIGVPRVIWLSDPCKGSANDATISKETGVKDSLSGEWVAADKAYRGDKVQFMVPLSGHRTTLDQEERAYNYLIYAFRQTVERLIRRIKVFGIFRVPWSLSLALHGLATRVICKMINLFLLFEPLDRPRRWVYSLKLNSK